MLVFNNKHKFTSASKLKLLLSTQAAVKRAFLKDKECTIINIAASTANCAEETHNQSKEHKPVSGFETISLITSVGESYF